MGKGQDLLNAARAGDKWTVEKIIGILTKRSGPFTNFSLRKCGLNVQDDNGYTPLHHACLNGHTDVVRLLLSAGASPAVLDKTGASPLHLAAWRGDSAIVTLLLAHNPPVNIDLVTADLETPLIMAAQYGSVNVVAQLVDRGADVTLRNAKDESALDLAAQYGRLETVKHLLATHPTLVHQYKYPNWRRYHKFQSTPLHRAAKNGHVEVVRVLLEAGIDPNIRTNSGTPLHEAACFGKASVVRILLEAGADLNEVDGRDKTVEELLADYSEEATRRVRRAIRDFKKNSSRHNYESEDEPRYTLHDGSPTSNPHLPGMCIDTDMAMREQSNAADNALTNNYTKSDKRPVSNAKTTATEIVLRKPPNAESPKHSSSHKYIQSFIINIWRGKTSNTTEQVDIYENLRDPSYLHFHSYLNNSQEKKFNGSLKKKPKPLPKPNDKNYENVYMNIPDDAKLRLKSQFGNENNIRKSCSGIYASMDAKKRLSEGRDIIKSETNRKSNISVSSVSYVDVHPTPKFPLKGKATGFHYRGSVGCINEDSSLLYDSIYYLKRESLRNNEYPFEKTKRKLDRLPCFCHCKPNELGEIYYSCENFGQTEVGNRSNEVLQEPHKSTDIDEVFVPFEKEEEDSSSTKRTGRIKNIFVKKITQLTQLLVDWDSSN